MYDFGNGWFDHFVAKPYHYEPKWNRTMDYNPDHNPSHSVFFSKPAGKGSRWFLQVKGLGVLTFYLESELEDPKGKLKPLSCSALGKTEIGCCPTL